MSRRRDGGSASLWVLTAALLVLVVGMAGGVRGLAVLARHRAESAADLAALAAAARIGAGGGYCARAADIAGRNGTRLAACRIELGSDGRTGWVRVVVTAAFALPVVGERTVSASARAGREPPAVGGGAAG